MYVYIPIKGKSGENNIPTKMHWFCYSYSIYRDDYAERQTFITVKGLAQGPSSSHLPGQGFELAS